ncbi:MAG: division/cell wall cluster transcriptional repressor MraZ, partial [Desulfosudaceae bacterium]
VLIPAELRTQADIREEIVIVGLVWYFKIWDKERYENQKAVFDKHVKSKEYQRVIQDMGL